MVFLPEWTTHEPAQFHVQMQRDLASPKHVLTAGPREFAKTFQCLIAEFFDGVHCRRLSQMHVGNHKMLAEEKLGFIITQLEENKFLQSHYNIRPGRIQRSDHFQIKVGNSRSMQH